MTHEKEIAQFRGSETYKDTDGIDLSALLEKAQFLRRGEPLTYGATPLSRARTIQQQLDLALDLQQLTYRDIPEDVPMEIIGYVHATFVTRFHNRAEANEENYMGALNVHTEFSPEVQEMFQRGELGQASASELLLTRQLLGIRSVELACLTHPYGKRIEDLLPEMREAVKDHVELLGGTYYDEPETRYRVKEIVGYDKGEEKLDKAVLMTRKRTMGTMPDGTIIRERSSFVLRLDDKSPFTKHEISLLNSVDLSQDDWQDKLMKLGKLDEVAALLLAMDEFSYAIPISTTIYAYNPETAQAIEKRDAQLLIDKEEIFAKEFPTIAAVRSGEIETVRVSKDYGAMFYSGPAISSEQHSKLFEN